MLRVVDDAKVTVRWIMIAGWEHAWSLLSPSPPRASRPHRARRQQQPSDCRAAMPGSTTYLLRAEGTARFSLAASPIGAANAATTLLQCPRRSIRRRLEGLEGVAAAQRLGAPARRHAHQAVAAHRPVARLARRVAVERGATRAAATRIKGVTLLQPRNGRAACVSGPPSGAATNTLACTAVRWRAHLAGGALALASRVTHTTRSTRLLHVPAAKQP